MKSFTYIDNPSKSILSSFRGNIHKGHIAEAKKLGWEEKDAHNYAQKAVNEAKKKFSAQTPQEKVFSILGQLKYIGRKYYGSGDYGYYITILKNCGDFILDAKAADDNLYEKFGKDSPQKFKNVKEAKNLKALKDALNPFELKPTDLEDQARDFYDSFTEEEKENAAETLGLFNVWAKRFIEDIKKREAKEHIEKNQAESEEEEAYDIDEPMEE